MKNARRNFTLAAFAALALSVAPSALADVRISVNLPLPPPPHRVLRNLPPLPAPPVVDFGYGRRVRDRYDDRCEDRFDDRYDDRWDRKDRRRHDRQWANQRYRERNRYVFVEGRWVERPFPGAVWVNGYYDRYGDWVAGYWARYR